MPRVRLVEAYAESTRALAALGSAYLGILDKQRAIAAFERVVDVDPDSDSIEDLLARARAD